MTVQIRILMTTKLGELPVCWYCLGALGQNVLGSATTMRDIKLSIYVLSQQGMEFRFITGMDRFCLRHESAPPLSLCTRGVHFYCIALRI